PLQTSDGRDRALLDRTFEEIGVPPWDVWSGRAGLQQRFYLFEGDREAVLGALHYSVMTWHNPRMPDNPMSASSATRTCRPSPFRPGEASASASSSTRPSTLASGSTPVKTSASRSAASW